MASTRDVVVVLVGAATVEVKRAWSLTVDSAEADALRNVLAAC
jgi:hypothetical protein